MLNHTKISTVIVVLVFVQFLFIDYIIGFMTDSQHERMMNNAFRRKMAEKNRKGRDLYTTRGNNDVIHREHDVTGEQVLSSSPPPTSLPLPCPTDCSCGWKQSWYLALDCQRHTNATSLSREINVYLPSVAWNLTRLSIQNTPLTAVPESICQLKRLTYLRLVSNNFITSLPDNCFSRLHWLQNFTAALCRLTSLQNGLFANLTNLQRVHLDFNHISSIDAHLFDNLINLQRVDLSSNHISSINAHVFANLTKLQYMDMSHNQISSIDAHLFDVTANLPNLRDIDLSHNNLTEIDTWPVKRAQLINSSNINLSYNHISRFNNSLGWHYDCDSAPVLNLRIDLSNNSIRHLNDLFDGWNITGLYLCIHARIDRSNKATPHQ